MNTESHPGLESPPDTLPGIDVDDNNDGFDNDPILELDLVDDFDEENEAEVARETTH
jgi:hypothetical protein